MTTKTIDGLRELLDGRAATAEVPAALSQRVMSRGRAARLRRRGVAGAGVLGLVGAACLQLGTGWFAGGDGGTAPASDAEQEISADEWSAVLPGLELPVGDPLASAYSVGDVVVLEGREIAMADEISAVIAVPEGAVVETGRVTGSVLGLATSLLLVGSEGEIETIDTGFIAGSAVTVEPDGSTQLVYGWLATATAATGEIRIRRLGAVGEPEIIALEHPAQVRGLDGSGVLISYLTDDGAQQSRLDTATGEQESLAEPGTESVEGVTASGLVLTWSDESQCFGARTTTGATAWEHCDGSGIGQLSPDRRWTVDLNGGTDAETGERVSTFDGLPQRGELVPGQTYLTAAFVGWESDDSAVFRVTLIDAPGDSPADIASESIGHVAVRCSVTLGTCERIPHPVDRVADPPD